MCLFILLHYSLLYGFIYQFKNIHILAQTTDSKTYNQFKIIISIHYIIKHLLFPHWLIIKDLGKFKLWKWERFL